MASRSSIDVPACSRCSTRLSGKCFIVDCGHLLCNRCSLDSLFSYRCNMHSRSVRITALAFCNQISKETIGMADVVSFALGGQCNCTNCNKNAIMDLKMCDHKLCIDCLEITIEDGNDRKLQYITCPVKNCQKQFPLIFADGIRGGCQISPQPPVMHDSLQLNVYLECDLRLGNDRPCKNKGCFYVEGCGYAVCYSCMMQFINDTHTPAYLNTSLTDVIYCLRPNCTKIITVERLRELLSKIVQEESKYEIHLSATHYSSSYCQQQHCRKNAVVFLTCGHFFCSTCFLFVNTKYIPVELDGKCMRCRLCPDCNMWIRESRLSPIILDENDFLSATPSRCNISEHGSAVISTRCCNLNLCLGCLKDILTKSAISTSIFGKEYQDVIKCMDICQLGIPRRFFVQFIKKHNYEDAIELSTQTELAGIHKKMTRKTTKSKEVHNEDVLGMSTQTSNVGKKHSNEFCVMYSELVQQSNNSLESSGNRGSRGDGAAYNSNATACNLGSGEQIKSDGSFNGGPSSVKMAPVNTTKEFLPVNITAAFKGIFSLTPVTDDSDCIKCRRNAFAKLHCQHSYCWVCLLALRVLCCDPKCIERVPSRDISDLFEKLQHNALAESGHKEEDSNSGRIETKQNTTITKTFVDGSAGRMKGVRNLGMTCYANSIFQILAQTHNFKEKLKDSFVEALKRTNQRLPRTDNLAAILEQLSGKSESVTLETDVCNFLEQMVSLEGAFRMNDCCEFLMCVFQGLKEEDETTTAMFENTMQTFFKFKPCDHNELGNPQISNTLLVPLSKGEHTEYSVSAGLTEFLKAETFDKGVLPCRRCSITTGTEKGLVLSKLPDILIIQIGRVKPAESTFTWEYAKRAQKSVEFVSYDEDLDVPQTSEVDSKIEEKLFSFRLFGVVLHSGSVDTGHYYSYVKQLHTNRWFSCNDSYVRPIEKKYVFGNPNAYLLFYEKKHVVSQHVITNHRASEICCLM